jgi:hypothetical protein
MIVATPASVVILGNRTPLGCLAGWRLTSQGSTVLRPGLSNQAPLGPADFARLIAPKVRHSVTQGATLGIEADPRIVALKK